MIDIRFLENFPSFFLNRLRLTNLNRSDIYLLLSIFPLSFLCQKKNAFLPWKTSKDLRFHSFPYADSIGFGTAFFFWRKRRKRLATESTRWTCRKEQVFVPSLHRKGRQRYEVPGTSYVFNGYFVGTRGSGTFGTAFFFFFWKRRKRLATEETVEKKGKKSDLCLPYRNRITKEKGAVKV